MMKEEELVNWVDAREDCSSLKDKFHQLEQRVTADVLLRNNHFPDYRNPQGGPLLEIQPMDKGFFTVRNHREQRMVAFHLESHHILIRKWADGDKESRNRKVTFFLNDDGDCRFQVDGQPREFLLWELSRLALEDLFFS